VPLLIVLGLDIREPSITDFGGPVARVLTLNIKAQGEGAQMPRGHDGVQRARTCRAGQPVGRQFRVGCDWDGTQI
jgi:hypothetical protein